MNESLNTPVVLLILIPLGGSVFSLFEKALPRFRVSRFMAILCVVSGAALLIGIRPLIHGGEELQYIIGGWAEPFGIVLYLDGLSWLGSAVIYGIAFPVLLFAIGERLYSSSFYFYFLVMIAAMSGLILTGDIFNMFVFFEILALCSYILIAYLKKPHAMVASFKYLMISTLGISFFLIGIFILYRLTGTLSVREIGMRLRELDSQGNTDYRIETAVAMACLLAGIGVRTAFIPFHSWLPEAHAYAPHPVSAILSGVMIKVSFIVLWRITSLFGLSFTGELLVITGAVTAAAGVIWALVQTDAKKLLAFHSISQMGYILAAFGAGTAVSLTASFYHLFNHALFKSLLFLSVGAVIACTGERDVKKMKGLGPKLPWIALPFSAAALSIAGIPPFNGYVSKQLISWSLKTHWIYPLIWFTGAGTVASFLKLSGIFRRGWSWRRSARSSRAGGLSEAEGLSARTPRAKGLSEAEGLSGLTEKPLPEGVLRPKKPFRLLYPSLWILAAACLLTGIAPVIMTDNLSSLLGFGAAAPDGVIIAMDTYPLVYAPAFLLKSLMPVGAGFLLYFAVVSAKGRGVSEAIRKRSFGLDGALVFIMGGFILFSLYGLAHIF